VIFVEPDNNNLASASFSVEYLFTRYIRSEKPVLMLWQAGKTVMLGNNQVIDAEVDIEYAEKSGILIVRRSSGGGAIYTDLGTVLYTIIEPLKKEAKIHREDVAANIIDALTEMGVPAKREGRNDILVEGRKVSGFAQYTSGTHICTHGSLLYDTDLDELTRVLIPNVEKLRPKGIASIRSRVTNIKPYIDEAYPVSLFIKKLKSILLNGKEYSVYKFSDDERTKLQRVNNDMYGNPYWNTKKL